MHAQACRMAIAIRLLIPIEMGQPCCLSALSTRDCFLDRWNNCFDFGADTYFRDAACRKLPELPTYCAIFVIGNGNFLLTGCLSH